jgi:hypothetical protein
MPRILLSVRLVTAICLGPFFAAGQTAPANQNPAPLRSRDRIALQVIFTYGESHSKTLPNGATITFESDRSGAFDATLDRYRAYQGVDSFKLQSEGQGNISVSDSMIYRVDGQAVTRREEGSGQPVNCHAGVHIDPKRGVYSLIFDIKAKTTVTLTGPGTPPKLTPNSAGLSFETEELPLPAGDDVIRGQAVFEPHLGSGSLGTNIVPEGRIMKQQDGGDLHPVHVRWQVGRPGPKPPLELILSVENYDAWLPEGATPESAADAPGNTAIVTAKLRRKDGGALERGALDIRFQISQSSVEPGTCLNFPIDAQPDPKQFDLRYVKGGDAVPTDSAGQTADTPRGNWQQATATLGSFDWGAYGSITAVAYVPDYGDVLATVEGTKKNSLLMPKRSDGSNIGDAWKEKFGLSDVADTADVETSPGNKNDGDGFTLYEEYRGLIARGKHSRRDADALLDPKKKDLVVLLAKQGRTATHGQGVAVQTFNLQPVGSHTATVIAGGRLLASAIGETHVVNAFDDEAPATRRMNPNSAYALSAYALNKPQHGVLLYAMNSGVAGDIGITAPLERRDKTPQKTDFVAIDFAAIASGNAAQREANAAGGLQTPYSLGEELANTVAHELAHACGAAHHGDRENQGPTRHLETTMVPPRYTVIGADGVEVATRPLEIKGQIAGDESRSSGDLRCIMCYPNYYAWRITTIRNQGYVWRAMVPLPMGATLCTGRDGTPPNTYFGPAATGRGSCRAKIKIKDA